MMTQEIGKYLIDNGLLDEDSFRRALKAENQLQSSFGEILANLGLVSEIDFANSLSQMLNIPMAGRDEYAVFNLSQEKLSRNFLKSSKIVPLRENNEFVEIAMTNPTDKFAIDAISMALGKPIRIKIGLSKDIEKALNRNETDPPEAFEDILKDININLSNDDDISRLKDMASEAPVIKLVNRIINQAINERASDIHIEPYENKLVLRYRIDGILREVSPPPAVLMPAIISRIKIMANLNIAERRLAQDGRVSLQIQGKMIDLRISILPSLYGESAVIRLLDTAAVSLDFEDLGMTPSLHEAFMKVMSSRHGILLVTGPTGSGKTTTLYAALKKLNQVERKIVTVEDPIEYQLDGITQVQVNPVIDMSFANVLRSIVRQDPDVIMIGEMRDIETAEIAVQSAQTGHMVLSTLHTNDAAGAISRLLDMGVEDYLINSTVGAVLGQRLVRRLCPDCREAYSPTADMLKDLKFKCETLYRPKGCNSCDGQGYMGRMGIYELLIFDESIRKLVLKRASTSKIHEVARQNGMITMLEDGLDKAREGLTTIEEIKRITREH